MIISATRTIGWRRVDLKGAILKVDEAGLERRPDRIMAIDLGIRPASSLSAWFERISSSSSGAGIWVHR